MPTTQDFFGDHTTALRWNTVNHQLQLKVDQVISTFRDLTVKYRADINTATGGHRHRCQIFRPLITNEPFFQDFLPLARYYEEKREARDSRQPLESELIRTEDLEDNVNRILPGGLRALLLEDFSISPGITLCSGRDRLRYTVKVRKMPQYVKHFHRMDSFLELKARADIEPVTKEVTMRVAPRLSLFRRNVTQNQNIRATVGYDITTDFTEAPSKGLYFSVTDSRWDLKFKQNRWQFTYAL